MNVLIEFVLFVVAIPFILIYGIFSVFAKVADFFGWPLIPGVLGQYLGIMLHLYGQPDPGVEWETVFQTLAGVSVMGIPLPLLLVITGFAFLAFGAVNGLRRSRF